MKTTNIKPAYLITSLLVYAIIPTSLLPSHEDVGIPAWMADMNRLMREAEDPRYQEPEQPARRLEIINPPMARRRQLEAADLRRSTLTPAELAQLEQEEMKKKKDDAAIRADIQSQLELKRIQEHTNIDELEDYLRSVGSNTAAQAIFGPIENTLGQARALGYNILNHPYLIMRALIHVRNTVRPEIYDAVIAHFNEIGSSDIAQYLSSVPQRRQDARTATQSAQQQLTQQINQPVSESGSVAPVTAQQPETATQRHVDEALALHARIAALEQEQRRQKIEAETQRVPDTYEEALAQLLQATTPETTAEYIADVIYQSLSDSGTNLLSDMRVIAALQHVIRTVPESTYDKVIKLIRKSGSPFLAHTLKRLRPQNISKSPTIHE